jgi:ABC-type transport system involved in multi-copper enzyme maturation permease subunit
MNPAPSVRFGGLSPRESGRLRAVIQFTLLEALRTRLIWIIVAVVAAIYVASLLVREIAITESLRFQTGFLAAGLRVAAVFMLALYVLASWLRDVNDKVLELMLSLDITRSRYLLGKYAGFCLVATIMALLCSIPVFLHHPDGSALMWLVSLTLELCIIAALSLFCINSLNQITPAAGFVAAFYLLARSISSIQLMSRSSQLAGNSWERTISSHLADFFALLLPGMDKFTQTGWLVDDAGKLSCLFPLLAQTVIYVALLLAASGFDLRRREL